MKVYHVTSKKAARRIAIGGFKDAAGTYLTFNSYTGVWVANFPLDENEGVIPAEIGFEIQIAGAKIRKFEWLEDGKAYREWLVPAEVLNTAPRRQLTDDELWDLRSARFAKRLRAALAAQVPRPPRRHRARARKLK